MQNKKKSCLLLLVVIARPNKMDGIIREIKNIYQKITLVKIDIPAMINNATVFVLAWFSALWVFQFFTIVPAFSLGAKMVVYTTSIDFNSMNTASSDRQIWSDTDNIVNIFGTPAIMLSIFSIVALVLLIKWNVNKLNIRRYLFWLVVCGSVRLAGNYISGALFGNAFNIWQWNLVTDFLGLSYSPFMKYLCVGIVLAVLYVSFRIMSSQIKSLFTSYIPNKIDDLLSCVFYPMLLGCLFIIIYNIPDEPFCDLFCVILMVVYSVVVFSLFFFKGITVEETETQENKIYERSEEKINKVSIYILLALAVLKVFVDIIKGGVVIAASLYGRFLFENIVLVSILIVLIVVAVVLVRIYIKRKKRQQRVFLRDYMETQATVEQSISEENNKNFGVKSKPKNMDKYLEGWVDSFDQKEESRRDNNTSNNMDNSSIKIDMDKYKSRWEKSMQ